MTGNRRIWILLAAVFSLVLLAYLTGITVSTGAGNDRPRIVITLGNDLSSEQKEQVLAYFKDWKKGKKVRYVTVSNQEERQYLQGKVDEKLIGSRAISSAYCELLKQGTGIEVQTKNITAITPFMYANALATTGVKNARVIVAAPFKVSGTAALTGIIKAFETASGEKLREENKQAAYYEIAETSTLGSKIGKQDAERLIYDTKNRVLKMNDPDPEEIRRIILEVSADLNIKLSETDINRIIRLMQRLKNLEISSDQYSAQLKPLARRMVGVESTAREAGGLLQKLIALMKNWWVTIRSMLA